MCTTTPIPDTASLSTAFNMACEIVSKRWSGSWRTEVILVGVKTRCWVIRFCSNLKISSKTLQDFSCRLLQATASFFWTSPGSIKGQSFSSSLFSSGSPVNSRRLNPRSRAELGHLTHHIRLPEGLAHAVHLLWAGAADHEIIGYHGAADQV